MQTLGQAFAEHLASVDRKECKRHPFTKCSVVPLTSCTVIACNYCGRIVAKLPPNIACKLTAYGAAGMAQITWQSYPIKDDRGKHGGS